MQNTRQPGAADLADFYWNDDGRYPNFRRWQTVDLSHRLAGGGFISTPSDLVKLGSAWLDDNFISPQTRAQFWQPQALKRWQYQRGQLRSQLALGRLRGRTGKTS